MRSRRPELHSADGLRVQARPRTDPLRSAGFKWWPNARRVMPGSRSSPKCATLVTQPLNSSIPPESCTGGPLRREGPGAVDLSATRLDTAQGAAKWLMGDFLIGFEG